MGGPVPTIRSGPASHLKAGDKPAHDGGWDTLHRTKRMLAMRLVALLLPILLGGCVSFSSSNPPPPSHTTVVVPQGSTVVCPGGGAPPC
jgi:hypothetical protein